MEEEQQEGGGSKERRRREEGEGGRARAAGPLWRGGRLSRCLCALGYAAVVALARPSDSSDVQQQAGGGGGGRRRGRQAAGGAVHWAQGFLGETRAVAHPFRQACSEGSTGNGRQRRGRWERRPPQALHGPVGCDAGRRRRRGGFRQGMAVTFIATSSGAPPQHGMLAAGIRAEREGSSQARGRLRRAAGGGVWDQVVRSPPKRACRARLPCALLARPAACSPSARQELRA